MLYPVEMLQLMQQHWSVLSLATADQHLGQVETRCEECRRRRRSRSCLFVAKGAVGAEQQEQAENNKKYPDDEFLHGRLKACAG
jgi:hypothetical protein